MCREAGLDPQHWQPFVEVQMAHVVAQANELPKGAGPLDDRIPSYMAHLRRLEPITIADTLFIAHADFTHTLPDPPGAVASCRAGAARAARPTGGTTAVPAPAPVSDTPTRALGRR